MRDLTKENLLQYVAFNREGSPTQTVGNEARCLELLNQHKGLKIIHQNIQGIRGNLKTFREKVVNKSDLDVIILSECITNSDYEPVPLEGYVAGATTRNHTLRNDGVVIYVRGTLRPIFKEYEVLEECNCLSVTLNNIIIVGIYRSPNKDKKAFVNSLDKLFLHHLKDHRNVFVLGDINLDLINKTNKDYIRIMDNHGFVAALVEPTRKNTKSGPDTCLDHIMAKTSVKYKPMIYPFNIADHTAQMCLIETCSRNGRTRAKSCNYSGADLHLDSVLRAREKQCEKHLIQQSTTLEQLSQALQIMFKDSFKPIKTQYEEMTNNCHVLLQMAHRINMDVNNNVSTSRLQLTTVDKDTLAELLLYLGDIETRRSYSTDTTLATLNSMVNSSITDHHVVGGSQVIPRGKLIEVVRLIVLNSTIKHIQSTNLVSRKQYIFKNKTQTNALATLIETVTKHLDNANKCLGVHINFNNTSVNRNNMSDKYFEAFKKYRVDDKDIEFIKTFTFTQNVNVSALDKFSFTLFVLYINKLLDAMTFDAEVIAFGAEILVIFAGKHWEETFNKAEHGLSMVNKWLTKHLSHYESKKIKYIPFGSTQKGLPPTEMRLKIHKCKSACRCRVLDRMKKITFGGVVVDNNMKWNGQMGNLIRKINHEQQLMEKIKNYLNENELKNVANAITSSILEDSVVCWGTVTKSNKQKLIKETLKLKYSKDDIYEMYIKQMLSYVCSKYHDVLDEVTVPTVRTEMARRSLSYTSVLVYNRLPANIIVDANHLDDEMLARWIRQTGVAILENHLT